MVVGVLLTRDGRLGFGRVSNALAIRGRERGEELKMFPLLRSYWQLASDQLSTCAIVLSLGGSVAIRSSVGAKSVTLSVAICA